MTGHRLIAVLAFGVDVAGYIDAPLTDPSPEEYKPFESGGFTTRTEDQYPEHPKRGSKTTMTVTISEDRASHESGTTVTGR